MPQCQFLFSAVFGFRKVVLEIFSELDETKAKFPIFLTRKRSPKERRRGAVGRPHHLVARSHLLQRRHMVRTPRASTDVAPSPINWLSRENPKYPSHIPRKVSEPLPPSTLTLECSEALLGTLPERGIITGGLFIAMPSSGVMWSSSSLDYGSIAVARWLSSPFVPSCLDLVSCLS